MYPHIARWLERVLSRKYRGAKVIVEDTSKRILSRWLFDKGFHRYFEDYQSYEIEVDITGIIIKDKKEAHLAFVECKLNKITLRDLSQLLGYSKVAKPLFSFILSPAGLSSSMEVLLNVFQRYDVLCYESNRSIIIGKWDPLRAEPDISSLIPRSSHLLLAT